MNKIHTIALSNVIQLLIPDLWLPGQTFACRCQRSHVRYVLFILLILSPQNMLVRVKCTKVSFWVALHRPVTLNPYPANVENMVSS